MLTATTDRSSTVGRALCHDFDASNMCYLVGHMTSSVFPELKKQRREQHFFIVMHVILARSFP
jgi:hypothetical protein